MLTDQPTDPREQGWIGGPRWVDRENLGRFTGPGPQGQGGPAAEGAGELFEHGRQALEPPVFPHPVPRELQHGGR
jgi:hypothetical protein